MTYAIALTRSDGRDRYAASVSRPQSAGKSARISSWTYDVSRALAWKTERGAADALARLDRPGARVVAL